MPKNPDEQIDDFARIALRAGMARAAMTQARRDARDKGATGTTAREVARDSFESAKLTTGEFNEP